MRSRERQPPPYRKALQGRPVEAVYRDPGFLRLPACGSGQNFNQCGKSVTEGLESAALWRLGA